MITPIPSITVTSECNRRCPDCCAGNLVDGPLYRATPESIHRDILALGEVERVQLTGGEPTLHPESGEILKAAARAKGSAKLVLVTNGANLMDIVGLLDGVDVVWLSIMSKSDERIALAFESVKPRTAVAAMVDLWTPRISFENTGGGPNPCGRLHSTVGVHDGRVFPCCVARAITGSESTDLSPGWRERVVGINPPCDRCVFGRG